MLAQLDRFGALTPGELAERERVQPPSMTKVIAGLVERGLVERSDHPQDRRQVVVSITAAGRAEVKETRRRRDAWLARRLAELGPAERQVLAEASRDPEEDRRLVSPTFRSLRIRNYRLWASGAIVSNTGTWMQRVAQDWLVLTGLTHNSGVAVGITTGLQFAPMLLLAPLAGAVADRVDRRRLLMATQSASGALALILGLLVVTGTVQLWQVYVLAGLLGVAAALDAPARQSFVSELVPVDDLPNAVGLNSASFHAGRLIGPGVAGLLIHWLGTGPVFLINGVSFAAVVISLTRMRVGDLIRLPRSPRGKGGVRAGLAYVRRRPDLMLIMAIVGVVGTFGLNFQLTTALMSRLVFDKGSGAYGLLGSVMAIGSLSGALLAARRRRPGIRLVIGATMAFGVAACAAALMPTLRDLRGRADPGGPDLADPDDRGQRHRPAVHRAGDARPGDGPLHGDLHGRHPDRCADHRLGRADLRRPVDDPGRRPGLAAGRDGGAGLGGAGARGAGERPCNRDPGAAALDRAHVPGPGEGGGRRRGGRRHHVGRVATRARTQACDPRCSRVCGNGEGRTA